MNSEKLTITDVERLLTDPSEDTRAEVAAKVVLQFSEVELAPRERELAHEILGYLVHDVAVSVREALSRCLTSNAAAPRSIVLQLARDIDKVAIPVLERSPVLTDEDLVGLVYYGSPEKQCAIAGRERLGAQVSEAIAHRGDRNAVLTLVNNSGAVINEAAATMLVERYADDSDVAAPLVQRGELPALLVERLIAMVSENIRTYLVERHAIEGSVAASLEEQARERTTSDAIRRMGHDDMRKLVAQLAQNNRLTPSLVLRAACAGEIRFVEAAFAAGGPHRSVRNSAHRAGRRDRSEGAHSGSRRPLATRRVKWLTGHAPPMPPSPGHQIAGSRDCRTAGRNRTAAERASLTPAPHHSATSCSRRRSRKVFRSMICRAVSTSISRTFPPVMYRESSSSSVPLCLSRSSTNTFWLVTFSSRSAR